MHLILPKLRDVTASARDISDYDDGEEYAWQVGDKGDLPSRYGNEVPGKRGAYDSGSCPCY